MTHPARMLFLFIDGLGIGSDDPDVNPVIAGRCPHVAALIRRSRPIDATLGVPGFPQSATGQTTLLTGVNAAALMGRHVQGFPGPRLRELIQERNLLLEITRRGGSATFANGYFVDDVAQVRERRLQSVTTVATLSAFGTVRNTGHLLANRAVCQDLTRENLRERGYDGPLVSPVDSAEHLLDLVAAHDLTLFEFFQTDRAGHGRDRAQAERILARLDRFVARLLENLGGRLGTLVLTSDHGNIEDLQGGGHTCNPVPFVVRGRGARLLTARVRSLVDVTPAILAWMERYARPAGRSPVEPARPRAAR